MYFPLDLCIYSENTACNQNSSSLLMSQNSACIFYCQQLAHLLRALNDCPRCMFFFFFYWTFWIVILFALFLESSPICHVVNSQYICVCVRVYARAYVTLWILVLTNIISSIILLWVNCNSVVRIQGVTFIHL